MDAKEIIKARVSVKDLATYYGLPLKGNCPTGHDSKGGKCFGITDEFFHCFNCGESGDVIAFVQLMEKVRTGADLDFKDALKWLVERYDKSLLPYIGNYREPTKEERERIERGSLYDQVYQYGKELLYKPDGREALDYLLTVRKFSLENIQKTDFMYFPPKAQIIKHLLKENPEASPELKEKIKALPLAGALGDEFKLAFPYRDRHGIITGFLKRSTQVRPDGKRWDSTAQTDKADIFNLNACKGAKDLLVVEGYPDALYLKTLGLDIVAVGQGLLSKAYIEGLQAYGIKGVTISFDNDHVGADNTEKALDLLNEAGIKSYVIDPPLLSPHKDPDEYVRGEGIDAFRELMKKAEYSSLWKLNRILSKHDLNTDKGEGDAIQEAIAFIATLQDSQEIRKSKGILRTKLEIPDEELTDLVGAYAERKREEEQKKGLQKIALDINRMVSSGEPYPDIQTHVSENLLQLRSKAGIREIEPYKVDALRSDLQKISKGLSTGYKSLDEFLSIKQGALTIIAGRPSHGKTTLMMNLLLNMVKEYPNKSFFYFSYEETRGKIAVKLINILGQTIIDKYHNTDQVEWYIKGRNTRYDSLNKALEEFNTYAEDNRLFVICNAYYITDLANVITSLCQRYDVGGVFVDYIQKIKAKEKSPSKQVEIQKISATLLETAITMNVPIILGAQVNREVKDIKGLTLETMREAGDIEQDANIVLGVWNPKVAQEDTAQREEGKTDLFIKILKNRDGAIPYDPVEMIFHEPVLKIGE